jgi:hypothetical protein
MTADPNSANRALIHSVYFKLNDDSAEAQEKLMAACRKYLTNHPGATFFSVATVTDLARPVNDRNYDVALHIHFENRAAHGQYQVSDRHVTFVNESKPNFKVVRVFDSEVRYDG